MLPNSTHRFDGAGALGVTWALPHHSTRTAHHRVCLSHLCDTSGVTCLCPASAPSWGSLYLSPPVVAHRARRAAFLNTDWGDSSLYKVCPSRLLPRGLPPPHRSIPAKGCLCPPAPLGSTTPGPLGPQPRGRHQALGRRLLCLSILQELPSLLFTCPEHIRSSCVEVIGVSTH